MAIADGVAVVVGVIVIWWVATHGKGTAPGRLAVWLVLLIVIWGIIAAQDKAEAMTLACNAARGIVMAACGISAFIRAIISH